MQASTVHTETNAREGAAATLAVVRSQLAGGLPARNGGDAC